MNNTIEIDWFDGIELKDDDEFTITGLKQVGDQFETDCAPGEETIFTAKIIGKPE